VKRYSPRCRSSSWEALLLVLAGLLCSGSISVAQTATSSNELRKSLHHMQSIEQLDQAEQKILRFIEDQRESAIVAYWWEPDGIGMRFENGKIGVVGLRSSGNPKTNPALQLPSRRLSAQAIEGSTGEDVVADAEVWQGAPDSNFGTLSAMLIGFDSSDATSSWGIFMPSFNSIPGNACSISMAQLIVDVVNIIEPGSISAHAVMSGSSNFWSETSITWNNRPDLEPGALSTVNISSAGLVEFSVTTVAQEWFSGSRDINGIYLRAPSAAFINVSTRESSDDPTFYYEYETCTGEPPDIETFGTGSISSESALLQSDLMTNGSDTNVAYRLGTSSGNYNTFISHEDNPFLGSGPTTQFADQVITGLNCEQTYFWQPLAENEFGSDIGSEAQFTTSQCPQDPPSAITDAASGIGQEFATLNATINPNGASTEARFKYGLTSALGQNTTWQTVGSGGGNISHTRTITGLQCDEAYQFRVEARNSGGQSNGSIRSFSTNACPEPIPGTPGSIDYPPSSSSGNFTVSWSSVSGATSYQLARSSNGGSNWSTIFNGSATSRAQSLGDGSYRYRARACNSSGCSNWRTGTFDIVVDIPDPIPGTPGSINYPSSSSSGNFTVSWSSVSGATSYELARSSNSGSTWSMIFTGSSTSRGQSLSDGNYRYRVRACNSSGCSSWRTGSFDIVVEIPEPVPGTPGSINYPPSSSTGIFTVSWSGVSGATSYELARSSNGGSTWSTIFTGSSTSRGQSLSDGNYRYRVRACNSSGCSSWRTGSFDIMVDPDVIFLDSFEGLVSNQEPIVDVLFFSVSSNTDSTPNDEGENQVSPSENIEVVIDVYVPTYAIAPVCFVLGDSTVIDGLPHLFLPDVIANGTIQTRTAIMTIAADAQNGFYEFEGVCFPGAIQDPGSLDFIEVINGTPLMPPMNPTGN